MAAISDSFKYDRVTFTCDQGTLHLKLQGPWVRTCGMDPDVNQALVLGSELEQFKDLNDVEGSVKFYYTSPPPLPPTDEHAGENQDDPDDQADVTLRKMAILSVTPDKFAAVDVAGPGEPPFIVTKTTWYLAVFVDARRKFIWPRGGAVSLGELNVEPWNPFGGDANGRTTYNPQKLANVCLTAMGLQPNAPLSLSDYPPPRNLQWRASHAPTELAKILNASNHRAYVDEFGDLQITVLGPTNTDAPYLGLPQPPPDRRIVSASRPQIDIRGQVVIVTTSPLAIMETKTITGIFDPNETAGTDPLDPTAPPKWEFVCRDKDGQWKPLTATVWFKNESPAEAVRNKFKNIDPDFRWQVATDTYYCVRLRERNAGPATVERFIYDVDPNDKTSLAMVYRPITIQAKIADLNDKTWLWSNLDDYKSIPAATLTDDGRVICSTDLLGKLSPGQEAGSPIDTFIPLAGDDLKIKISREKYELDVDTNQWHPTFYNVGLNPPQVGVLSDDEIKVALAKPDTVVVRRPELRPLILEGEFQARSLHEQSAAGIAAAYTRRGGAPQSQQMLVAGYWFTELSGRVERIEYDPQGLVTRIDIDTFWMPGATYLPASMAFDKPALNEKHPGQLATASVRTASGSAGYTQPTALLAFPRNVTPPALRYGTIASDSGFDVRNQSYLELKPSDVNGNVTGSNIVRVALRAGGFIDPAGIFAYLPTPGNAGAFGIDGKDSKPTEGLIVDAPRFAGLQRVSLVMTSGSAGNATTTCSFVYSVFPAFPKGDTILSTAGSLADGLQPEMSPGRIFPMTCKAATVGMAYWDETGWVLAYAFEAAAGSKVCS